MSELPFPHHTYQNDPGEGSHELFDAESAAAVSFPEPRHVSGIVEQLRRAGVRQIILVHGTFAGDDVLGLVREIGRLSPGMAGGLKRLGKQLVDQIAGDVGNYTTSFVRHLSDLILANGGEDIEVTRFHWSGENHHLGRAGGAMALLDRLLLQTWQAEDRILVWAHSHGGNLLAMMSQLLGAGPAAIGKFFTVTHHHYQVPMTGRFDLADWERVKTRLLDSDVTRRLPKIDVATFGTPLRYRWNTQVCEKLIHFVQHRPCNESQPARAGLPTTINDVATARGGDYVQQLAIGGTDFPQSLLAWRSWLSERGLRRMFASGIRRRDVPRNLSKGHRVSLDGTTLLVDYAATPEKWREKLAGHGVYTRPEWTPFHLREIIRHFYE